MNYVYCTLIGYLIGAFNPAYLLAKIRGFDIRKKGSRNAGASNALIVFGKVWGAVCAVLDIAKAYVSIWVAELALPNFTHAFAVTGVACILGHIFPFYMKFKGGKGLACLAGMVLRFDWRVFLIMLAGAVCLVLVSDYICLVPVCGSLIFPAVYGIMRADLIGALILMLVGAVVFVKHIPNFRRIRVGTEMHISYLWRPEAELARMRHSLTENGVEIDEELSDQMHDRIR